MSFTEREKRELECAAIALQKIQEDNSDVVTVTLVRSDGTTKADSFRIDLDAPESGNMIVSRATRLILPIRKSVDELIEHPQIVRWFVRFDPFFDAATALEFTEFAALRSYLRDADDSVDYWQWDDDAERIGIVQQFMRGEVG